jgi:mRNA-degrading endonuclease RelE of RelBE toxin-antitoxin system
VKVVFTKPFVQDYRSLPHSIQLLVDKSLSLLSEDPKHPSLRIKKIQGAAGRVFEGRVSRDYRFTFQVEEGTYLLRRVGSHDRALKSP